MPTNRNARVDLRKLWIDALCDSFYSTGLLAALGCFGVTLADNTALLDRLQYADFPLSWALGVVAIFAFLGAEACHVAYTHSQPAVRDHSVAPPETPAYDVLL